MAARALRIVEVADFAAGRVDLFLAAHREAPAVSKSAQVVEADVDSAELLGISAKTEDPHCALIASGIMCA